MDVGLGEYVQKEATASWLAAYRLLCKSTPCIPEVAIRMAQLSEFERSFTHVLLYPPQPAAMLELEGRQGNFSARMYGAYVQEQRQQVSAGAPIRESFLVWHRSRHYDSARECVDYRGGQHQHTRPPTLVVACRYWYELTDGFWGQLVLTQIPHMYAKDLLPLEHGHLRSMQNFAGMLEYLSSWQWRSPGTVEAVGGTLFEVQALPLLLDDEGAVQDLGPCILGGAVFSSVRCAFEYLMALAKRDIQYRGMRDDRVSSFSYKQDLSRRNVTKLVAHNFCALLISSAPPLFSEENS